MPAAALAIPFPAHSMDPPAMPKPKSKPISAPAPPPRPATEPALLAANLFCLLAMEANGMDDEASAMVDRIAAGLARKPRVVENVGGVSLPAIERGRSAYELAQLDQINARLSRPYKPHKGLTADEQRERDLRARDALERAPEAKAEAESVVAASMRRVMDADPLLSLARAGHITPDQLDTGRTVTDLYDSRASEAGAMDYTATRGGSHNNDRYCWTKLDRAKASEMLGRIERQVAINCSAEPACLTMLRVVCERGMAVTSQGKGRAFERNARALGRALDVADDVLKRRI